MNTCAEQRELQRRMAMNLAAMRVTVKTIDNAISDEDAMLAIEEIDKLISQSKGLSKMIKEADSKNFLLTPEG